MQKHKIRQKQDLHGDTQGFRPTRLGEDDSNARNDDALGVATQGFRPTRLGEDESSVRYDGAQGVATQGLRPTRLGEDESSVRHEWGGGSREALEQRIAGQQGRWQRQGHGLWQELEQERVRER
jgi:hypothetical protein